MKYRTARPQTLINSKKTSEEIAIDAIFADEPLLELELRHRQAKATTLELDTNPPTVDETAAFEISDFGLDGDESKALYEEHATNKVKQFNEVVIKTIASLNALKSVEDHVRSTFEDPGAVFLSKKFLLEVTTILDMRLKQIILGDMDFDNETAVEVFRKVILKESTAKVVDPERSLLSLIYGDEKAAGPPAETGPYGLSTIRSMGEK